VQRLFTTFADGLPGAGLLLLRLFTGAVLIDFGISGMHEGPQSWNVALQIIGISAAISLLLGMFTPVAGVLAAAAKVWIAISQFSSHSGDPSITLAQAILAAALAMIGPGVWSIDAQRYGRKHIVFSER
jgi:putative oxidoreductase